jgi:phage terminase large subunit GpA-like protein
MLGAERIVRAYRRGVAVRQWKKDPAVRNEALDCRVYAYAALSGLVARGFRLDAESGRIADLPLREKATPQLPAGKATVIRSRWMES